MTEVTITQADREAAAAYYYSAGGSPNIAAEIRDAKKDTWFRVQAFARHRALTPAQAAGPVLLEALKAAMKAIEDDRGLDDAICCSGYMCACQGSSHRQLLLHNLSAAITQAEGPQV